jgi:hypothetical protein
LQLITHKIISGPLSPLLQRNYQSWNRRFRG